MLYSNGRSFVRCGAVACAMALLFCCNNVKTGMKPCDGSAVAYNFINNDYIYDTEWGDMDEHASEELLKVELENGVYRADKYYYETMVREDTEEQIEEEIRDGEIELLAQLTEAEAGNQDYIGKCLVADVVLNRIKSDRFPDSIEEVIFEEGQFSCISDGGFDKAGWNISEDSFRAARHEYMALEIDYDILFFTAGGYNKYCIPAYKHGDHYFGY